MAIALAITAAACWGLSDFLAGLVSRRVAVLIVLLLVEGGGLAVAVTVTLATGEPFFSHAEDAWSAVAGGLASVIGLGCFYRALSIGTMSVVAPISAAGVALPVVVGVVSGDRPSAVAAAGLGAIVIGIVLSSREQHADAEAAAAGRTAVMLALVSAVGFGGFFALTDAPADSSVPWTLVLARGAPIPFILALLLLTRPAARPSPRLALGIAAVGTVDLAAMSLIAVANTKGDLSTVSVLSSMYPVATMLLAAVILHERLARPQLAGVVLALAGITAVAAG
jgi:drug/metabolite transporter (DMT)-like permease